MLDPPQGALHHTYHIPHPRPPTPPTLRAVAVTAAAARGRWWYRRAEPKARSGPPLARIGIEATIVVAVVAVADVVVAGAAASA